MRRTFLENIKSMAKILIVEDDPSTVDVLQDFLESEQYTIDVARNGSDAIYLLKNYQFDLAIVDWGLPDLSGCDVIQNCRKFGSSIKILMITGKREAADTAEGLDAGADDYVTKPFHLAELAARIRALLRRPGEAPRKTLNAGPITIDTVAHRVTVEGEEIKLLPKEYALLEFLIKHEDQVFSVEALLDRVWQSESLTGESAVRTCVTRLRKKISTGKKSSPKIISIHGEGYKLVVENSK